MRVQRGVVVAMYQQCCSVMCGGLLSSGVKCIFFFFVDCFGFDKKYPNLFILRVYLEYCIQ